MEGGKHHSTDSVVVQSQRGSGVNVTEEQLFEHERFMPLAGWSIRTCCPLNATATAARRTACMALCATNVCVCS